MANLIDTFWQQFATDETNTDKESERIVRAYQTADTKEKAVIDDIMISLCGYSIPSLLEMTEQ